MKPTSWQLVLTTMPGAMGSGAAVPSGEGSMQQTCDYPRTRSLNKHLNRAAVARGTSARASVCLVTEGQIDAERRWLVAHGPHIGRNLRRQWDGIRNIDDSVRQVLGKQMNCPRIS